MTDKEAMKLALDALELMYACYANPEWISHKQQEEKILAQCVATTMTLRQAIKELESQEPVAILNHAHGVHTFRNVNLKGLPDGEYLVYTHPPQRTEQEPVAVKRMKEWVEFLKRQSDNGQHMNIPSSFGAGTCWEIAIELEQFINTHPPQRTEPICPECKAEVLYECVACSSNNYPPQHTEQNFCSRCGKRTKDIHTCTPPKEST
jgi:hypothetical protein